jgi:hypothetical protein
MGQHAAAVILATAVQNESVREPWLGVPKRRLQGWRGAEGFWRWGVDRQLCSRISRAGRVNGWVSWDGGRWRGVDVETWRQSPLACSWLAAVFLFFVTTRHSLLLEIGSGDRTGTRASNDSGSPCSQRSPCSLPGRLAMLLIRAQQSSPMPSCPPIQSKPGHSSPSRLASILHHRLCCLSPLFPSGLELSRSSSASPPEAHEPLPATPRWASAPPTPLLVASIPSFSSAFASPFRSLPQVRFSRR